MCPNTWGRVWHQADHPAIREVPALGFAAVLGNSVPMRRVRSVSLTFGCYIVWGAMTSCVMSWCCTCTGHMTFCYKSLVDVSFEAFWLFWLLVHPSGSPLSPMYGWCLMCVGHDMSSMSPGWSLLPSSIFIVLALVNSTVSHKGT